MTVWYLDSSVLIDIAEVGSRDWGTELNEVRGGGALFASSSLARLELARYAHRLKSPDDGLRERLQIALAPVDLVGITELVLAVAADLKTQHLGTLDAIHVATALLVEADVVLTRDLQMARACEELGLAVA